MRHAPVPLARRYLIRPRHPPERRGARRSGRPCRAWPARCSGRSASAASARRRPEGGRVGMRAIGLRSYLGSLPAGIAKVTLDELLEQADAVSLHMPLTAESRHLIGEAALRKMKPTACWSTRRAGHPGHCGADPRPAGRMDRRRSTGRSGARTRPRDSPLLSSAERHSEPARQLVLRPVVPELKRKTAETAVAGLTGSAPGVGGEPGRICGSALRARQAIL